MVAKTQRKNGDVCARIEFGAPKTDKAAAPAFVAELLAEHRAEVSELRRFQKICESIGLPRLRLYGLRHTRASLLINEGVQPKRVSERLGKSLRSIAVLFDLEANHSVDAKIRQA